MLSTLWGGQCPNPCAAQVSTVLSGRPSPPFSLLFSLLPSSFDIRQGKANAIEVNSPSLTRVVSLSHLGCWLGTSPTLRQFIKVIIHVRTVLLSRDMSQAALDNGSPLGWLPEGLLACPKQPLGDLVDLPASHWLIWASSLLSKPLPSFFLSPLPSFHLSIHKYLAEIQP